MQFRRDFGPRRTLRSERASVLNPAAFARVASLALPFLTVACGSRSSLPISGAGGDDTSSNTVSDVASSSASGDPCGLPPGVQRIADLPLNEDGDPVFGQEISVSGGQVVFRGSYTVHGVEDGFPTYTHHRYLYGVPVCGGVAKLIAGQPPPFWAGSHVGDENGIFWFEFNDMEGDDGLHHLSPEGVDSVFTTSWVSFEDVGMLLDGGELYAFAGGVTHVNKDGTLIPVASSGGLVRHSNFTVAGDEFVWIGSLQDGHPGPIFSTAKSGSGLDIGPEVPVPLEIAGFDGGVIAAYGDPAGPVDEFGSVVRIDLEGSSTVLVSGELQPYGLLIRRDRAFWQSNDVVRSVPIAGGEVSDIDGTPGSTTDVYDVSVDARDFTADDEAVYHVRDGGIYRIPY